jgi:molecular chaperone GrpE
MPSNGSRHSDDALGRADSDKPDDAQDVDDRGRGEGKSLPPEREVSEGPRVRDLRGSRDESGRTEIPNVFEGLSPDLTTSTEPEDEVVTLTNERDELLDALRRNQADFENYKKRVERQSAEQRDRANERIVERLLPALDAFSLARAHLGDKEPSSVERALLQAAALFEDALSKEGLERIEADGVAFDPTSHEAVDRVDADASDAAATSETDDAPPSGPTVAGVLRPGYVWKGRVIRPAMVRVRG